MTEEFEFQAALDADPSDWLTRLVFADWLQERDDPRAAGYRELGNIRFVPLRCNLKPHGFWWVVGTRSNNHSYFPDYWDAEIDDRWFSAIPANNEQDYQHWRYRKTRRELEDAVALAYPLIKVEVVT